MVTQDFLLDGNHFIILDVSNTVNDNGITKIFPFVQIVDESNEIVYQDIETIKNRVENALMLKEKRKDLFTISLNVASDYVIPCSGK